MKEKDFCNAPTSGQLRTTALERFGTVFRLWLVLVCAFIGQTTLRSTKYKWCSPVEWRSSFGVSGYGGYNIVPLKPAWRHKLTVKSFHALQSQMDSFAGTCPEAQCPHSLDDWPGWESSSRNTPSFQSFIRKGESESWSTVLDYYAVLYFLLQISAMICVWHQGLPTTHSFSVSVPPVVTNMTQVWLSLSTAHQNLWPRHSRELQTSASILTFCL